MAQAIESFAALSDDELISTARVLAGDERRATARLIGVLAELDRRKLFLDQGCSSLFTYCTQVLHLSEHAAYSRIEAARAVQRFPAVFEALQDGTFTLTTACLLVPVMTDENYRQLLTDCGHKSKREVERVVASVRPQPDVALIIRKLPAARQETLAVPIWSSTDSSCAKSPMEQPDSQVSKMPAVATPRRAVVAPLAPERYKIQFTASRDTYEKLRSAQELLRHVIPNGDPAAVFDRALTVLLADLMRTRMTATERPRSSRSTQPGSRHIPAAVRREVWRRDGARCAFVGPEGRCAERGFLELHHVQPFAKGGAATVENISLRCRAHNGYEAEEHFGPFVLREERAEYHSVRTESTTWHEIGAKATDAA